MTLISCATHLLGPDSHLFFTNLNSRMHTTFYFMAHWHKAAGSKILKTTSDCERGLLCVERSLEGNRVPLWQAIESHWKTHGLSRLLHDSSDSLANLLNQH